MSQVTDSEETPAIRNSLYSCGSLKLIKHFYICLLFLIALHGAAFAFSTLPPPTKEEVEADRVYGLTVCEMVRSSLRSVVPPREIRLVFEAGADGKVVGAPLVTVSSGDAKVDEAAGNAVSKLSFPKRRPYGRIHWDFRCSVSKEGSHCTEVIFGWQGPSRHITTAEAAEYLRELRKAVVKTEKALGPIDPSVADQNIEAARFCDYTMQDPACAAEFYERAVPIYAHAAASIPHFSDDVYMCAQELGNIYENSKQFDRAEHYRLIVFDYLHKLKPLDLSPYFSLSEFYDGIGKADKAEAILKEALVMANRLMLPPAPYLPVYAAQAQAHDRLGRFLEKHDRTDEALSQYKIVWELLIANIHGQPGPYSFDWRFSDSYILLLGRSGRTAEAAAVSAEVKRLREIAFRVKPTYRSGYINKTGQLVIEKHFGETFDFCDGLARVKSPDRTFYGYINHQGNYALPAIYTAASDFESGKALVNLQANPRSVATFGSALLIDKAGKRLTPLFYELGKFVDGLAPAIPYAANKIPDHDFRQDRPLWGFAKENGEFITPVKYSQALPFHDGFAAVEIGGDESFGVSSDGEWGLIDSNGRETVPPKYAEIAAWNRQFFIARSKGENEFRIRSIPDQGLLMELGKGTPTMCDDGTFIVHTEQGYGLMRGDLSFAIKPSLGDFACFCGELAEAKWNWKVGFINRRGSFVIEQKYAHVGRFSEGLAPAGFEFSEPNACGFIDKSGKMVIGPKFEVARAFSEGLAAVSVGWKWGFINTKGEFVIPPQFDEVGDFHEGVAWVRKE
jgi:tetratricopeptide (TPR) repeat protein